MSDTGAENELENERSPSCCDRDVLDWMYGGGRAFARLMEASIEGVRNQPDRRSALLSLDEDAQRAFGEAVRKHSRQDLFRSNFEHLYRKAEIESLSLRVQMRALALNSAADEIAVLGERYGFSSARDALEGVDRAGALMPEPVHRAFLCKVREFCESFDQVSAMVIGYLGDERFSKEVSAALHAVNKNASSLAECMFGSRRADLMERTAKAVVPR